MKPFYQVLTTYVNDSIALRMAKTPMSFGHSECNRVKVNTKNHGLSLVIFLICCYVPFLERFCLVYKVKFIGFDAKFLSAIIVGKSTRPDDKLHESRQDYSI